MQPFDHVLHAAFASNLLTAPTWVPSWSAYHSIGALNKPFRGVSKITINRLRQFPEVSSIIRHSFGIGHPFFLYYSHLTKVSTISLSV